MGRYVVENPVLSAAQAAGSFVGPGLAVKGGNAAARLAGASAQNVARGGLAGGAAAGAVMAGGDAAGTAYDLASKAEASEAVAAFSGKSPTTCIQAMQLAQSVNQRQKRIRVAQQDGVYLPRAGRMRWRRGGSRCRSDTQNLGITATGRGYAPSAYP